MLPRHVSKVIIIISKWLFFYPIGKSTFLRQNALIVILAQAGSFVPAQSAMIGKYSKHEITLYLLHLF